jgi:hypothetical protein
VHEVRYHPAAEAELDDIPAREQAAVRNAEDKLKSLGNTLGYPYSSAVKGANNLRELRPRSGNSPWRALYRQVGEVFVIAAISPEAQHDKRGFDRACRDAEDRLTEVEE